MVTMTTMTTMTTMVTMRAKKVPGYRLPRRPAHGIEFEFRLIGSVMVEVVHEKDRIDFGHREIIKRTFADECYPVSLHLQYCFLQCAQQTVFIRVDFDLKSRRGGGNFRWLMPVVRWLIEEKPGLVTWLNQQRAGPGVGVRQPLREVRVCPKRRRLIIQEIVLTLARGYDTGVESGEGECRFPARIERSQVSCKRIVLHDRLIICCQHSRTLPPARNFVLDCRPTLHIRHLEDS